MGLSDEAVGNEGEAREGFVPEVEDSETASEEAFEDTFEVAHRIRRELEEHRLDRRSKRHLSRLAHAMDVGVVLLDDGLRVLFASERARVLLGEEPSEFDRRWSQICDQHGDYIRSADCDPSVEERRELLIEAEEPGQTLLRLSIQHFDDDEDVAFLVLIRDAQAAAALERDLRLAAQLRGLMGLYMGLTHDLKAPMNAMVLNLELLKRSLETQPAADRDLSARRRRRLEIFEEELHRLERSLERLLAQTAPARKESVHYDLAPVVAEIGEFLAPQAKQQKVELEIEIPDRRLFTRGSPDLLKQALVNLAVNGFEAQPDGGHMGIEVVEETLDGEPWIVIRVRDRGPGIPPEARHRLFELHFTTKEMGTGLGLYVTKALVDSQHGRLSLRETGPEGTTFELALPAAGCRADEPGG